MRASRVRPLIGLMPRNTMNLRAQSMLRPGAALYRSLHVRVNAKARKILRTHLSTALVDFSETRGMKDLRRELRMGREFLEDYKRDTSGH